MSSATAAATRRTSTLTPGQAHETTAFETLLAGADEQVVDEGGEPTGWPVALAGDKGSGGLDRQAPDRVGNSTGDPVEGE